MFRYQVALKIDQVKEWDAVADHELIVTVGKDERRDKIEIAAKPSEMNSGHVEFFYWTNN